MTIYLDLHLTQNTSSCRASPVPGGDSRLLNNIDKVEFFSPQEEGLVRDCFFHRKEKSNGKPCNCNCRLKRRALGNWDCYNHCCQTPERNQVRDCCICSDFCLSSRSHCQPDFPELPQRRSRQHAVPEHPAVPGSSLLCCFLWLASQRSCEFSSGVKEENHIWLHSNCWDLDWFSKALAELEAA